MSQPMNIHMEYICVTLIFKNMLWGIKKKLNILSLGLYHFFCGCRKMCVKAMLLQVFNEMNIEYMNVLFNTLCRQWPAFITYPHPNTIAHTAGHILYTAYMQHFKDQISFFICILNGMKFTVCLYSHGLSIFLHSFLCPLLFHWYILILLHLLISIFISSNIRLLFPDTPRCLHVTQKLTEAGSILGDICHQQCMTVEKSVKIYRAPYWMVPIDLHLPDTVSDRANQPITAPETNRHSFTGEMGWDEFDWLTDCHRATGALQNHRFTEGE